MIVYRKNKKQIKDELRKKGLTPKAVFTADDIKDVLAFEFLNSDVTDKEIQYLKSNLDDWNKQQ